MIEQNELAHEVSEDVRQWTIGEMLGGDLGFFLPYQYSSWERAGDGIGGVAVTDPLTVYASIDVFGDDTRVTFKTTITALLDDLHEGYVGSELKLELDSKDLKMLTTLRDALAKEVGRVDEWIRTANIDDERDSK
jgi:hypothetical protein